MVDDLRLLHSAGFSLALRQYLCGDELYTDMFADMDQWLMERVCGAPAPARGVSRPRLVDFALSLLAATGRSRIRLAAAGG